MTADDHARQPETLAAQALGWEDADGGLAPAIQPATTFNRRDVGNDKQFSYTRADNPTYTQVETLLSQLEGGNDALLFASGMAAAVTLFQSLPAGASILANDVMYWGVRHWLNTEGAKQGLNVSFFATGDMAQLQSMTSGQKVNLIWIECPANPMWQISDITAAAEIAHRAGARLAVDNTVATPVLTRPLELGADYVMHSATKYLNGHSDALAGALICRQADDHWNKVGEIRTFGGAVLGPFESWLLLRGMRTLYLRVRAASASALTIAQHFQSHGAVTQVLYPGLPNFPNHEVAVRQMDGGFSGMLSIRVNGGEAAAARVAGRTQLWKEATSLGGVESLIEHRAPVEGPGSPVPRDLLRMSTGIEHVDDLIADLEAALA
jgi:cystathionine gamma-synthase